MAQQQPAPEESLRTPPRDRLVGRREAIQGVVMGAGERSYLVREGEINVMRNAVGGLEDAAVRLTFTPPAKTPASARRTTRRASLLGAPGGGLGEGEALTPSRAMLMGRESQLAMLTPSRKSSLMQADIETGRVVREWNFQKDGVDIPMEDIVGDTKAAQLEARQTFLGLGTNRLVRWDLRDPTGAVQESPVAQYAGGRDYARNTNFTCLATSGDGYVAVGSRDGRVRLYSEGSLSQAKTSVPSLGAPVTAIDVTFDGRWVVATTDRYLMVLKTSYRPDGEEGGPELCGFTSRMGARAPAPRLLRLRPEDALRTGGAAFQKAHFTWVTERGRQERWVVASCGAFTVRWNLRSVKIANAQTVSAGGLTTVSLYQLIPKQEHVVDSTFMHENFARGRGKLRWMERGWDVQASRGCAHCDTKSCIMSVVNKTKQPHLPITKQALAMPRWWWSRTTLSTMWTTTATFDPVACTVL